MASLRYVRHELSRRWSRTFVTALGLAAGVGLVMGIVGVSNGLSDAQNKVLSPLSSVGTDIVVERTVGVASTSGATTTTTTTTPGFPGGGGGFAGGGGGGGGGFFAGRGAASLNASDSSALASNNSSIITDLAKLGPPGTQFTYDFFVPGTLITFPQQAVADVAKLKGVQAAVPALSLQALHETGTVPSETDTVTTGGQTITSTVKPPALTQAQIAQIRQCFESSGAFQQSTSSSTTTTTLPGGTKGTGTPAGSSGAGPSRTFAGGAGGGGGGGGGIAAGILNGRFGSAFSSCLPASYQQYIDKVVVPEQTITRVLNPPTTNTATSSYTVAGVDPKNTTSGLITKAQLVSGTWFTASPANEILVAKSYASTENIKVGQTMTIDKAQYKVVGLVNPSLTGDSSDIYFDLATLQSSASQGSRINEVLVKVAKSSDVNTVAAAIKKELPGATILTSKQLAGQVTGSLSNAKKLASDLGVALGVIILIAALLIAALLTLSNIAKRVREIGTLRAIGWSRRRVVGQIMAEMLGIGIVGAALGVLIGLGVCGLVDAFGPTLTYTTTGVQVGASSASNLLHTVGTAPAAGQTVKLHTSISALTVIVAAVIAIAGGLVAGLAGAWRASRLSPVEALRDLG
ncbi:MAG TPA: FtsX-like permease family protein [Acidimicrobiales bacterium]|nr:FtsX-like permease family protein [Acidimicrobiales bacterium]